MILATHGIVGSQIVQFTGLLDTYTGAAAAYSLRLLRADYTGDAIEVRIDTTGQPTYDIGFVNGELDTATLEGYCTGGLDAFVTTWYDQSGNGNDATQGTDANQPQIVSSGSVIEENGKPSVEFDGNNRLVLSSFSYSNLTAVVVAKTTSVPANNAHALAQSTGFLLKTAQNTSNYPRFQPYDTGYKTAEYQVDSLNTQLLLFGYTSSGNAYIYVNQNTGTTASISTLNNPTFDINIGDLPSFPNSGNDGPIQEVILYPSDQSSNRSGIQNNINDFYSIY